jgi:hypothetical protein
MNGNGCCTQHRCYINVVKRGILIGSIANSGSILGGVLGVRNLNRSLALPEAIIGVIGVTQMVFNNPITIIHVTKIANRPLMSSMVVGRYRNVDVAHPKGGYQKPIVIIVPILDHRDSHYVR